ncbi:agmatinase [candidate division WOR-3 bacterium]|nr:agmatinase [candidate division WOR-3 bacterium]
MAFYYATAGASDARIVVVGMPFDRTSSFIPGARFGPDIIRIAADNIESFSPYQKRDVSAVGVRDAGNVEFTFATANAPLELIAATTAGNLARGVKQLALGGEHTITPPVVAELTKKLPDLCVVQYDAHSDLRQEFLGERVCHATAMARVLDFIPRDRLFQLGIRSFSRAEEMSEPNVFPFDVLDPVKQVRAAIGDRPVYLTLDIDVLDPGAMPDVQTPEPGGCSFRDLALSLAGLAGLKVVGCDLVEVCPRTLQPSAGAAAAAELVRELCLLLVNV